MKTFNLHDSNDSGSYHKSEVDEEVEINYETIQQTVENEGMELEDFGPIFPDGTENIWDAASFGSLPAVRYYFNQDPNCIHMKYEDELNLTLWNALHYACEYGHLEIVHYLITKGVAVDSLDNHRATPLLIACVNGHLSLVNYLINKGADINHMDREGNSPVHMAVFTNNLELVVMLLKRGARAMVANRFQMRPRVLALYLGNRHEVFNYLSKIDKNRGFNFDSLYIRNSLYRGY